MTPIHKSYVLGAGVSGPRYFHGPSIGHSSAPRTGGSGPRFFHGPSIGHGSAPATGISGPRYFYGSSIGHGSAPRTGGSGPRYFCGLHTQMFWSRDTKNFLSKSRRLTLPLPPLVCGSQKRSGLTFLVPTLMVNDDDDGVKLV